MKSALPAGFAVLGALWPVFTFITALSSKVTTTAEAQTMQGARIEQIERVSNEEIRTIRNFLESVDRRLSRIEGRLGARVREIEK